MIPLLIAIMSVETGGHPDPDHAVGADYLSFGALQITDICREDINRICDTAFTREHCASRQASIAMFKLYIYHYATAERLGHPPTDEDRARIWNGGPTGWHKQATIPYWHKVQRALAERSKARPHP